MDGDVMTSHRGKDVYDVLARVGRPVPASYVADVLDIDVREVAGKLYTLRIRGDVRRITLDAKHTVWTVRRWTRSTSVCSRSCSTHPSP